MACISLFLLSALLAPPSTWPTYLASPLPFLPTKLPSYILLFYSLPYRKRALSSHAQYNCLFACDLPSCHSLAGLSILSCTLMTPPPPIHLRRCKRSPSPPPPFLSGNGMPNKVKVINSKTKLTLARLQKQLLQYDYSTIQIYHTNTHARTQPRTHALSLSLQWRTVQWLPS